MFALRIINKKTGVQENFVLGDNYQYTPRNSNGFEKLYADTFGLDAVMPTSDKFGGMIKGERSCWFTIEEGFGYFIVSENGQTYDNLTIK